MGVYPAILVAVSGGGVQHGVWEDAHLSRPSFPVSPCQSVFRCQLASSQQPAQDAGESAGGPRVPPLPSEVLGAW